MTGFEQLESRRLCASAQFAVIGDPGSGNAAEGAVSRMVKAWNTQFVVSTGDNTYASAGNANYDKSLGQFYSSFIGGYHGAYGTGPADNRFYSAMGNHDWDTGNGSAYKAFLNLPGNERHYDVVRGPVHLFFVSSDPRETSGISSTSVQANWLKGAMRASTSPWNIVVVHHPPYTSGNKHGPATALRWDYKSWGADLVIDGHEHIYERIERPNGLTYVTNGLSGAGRSGFISTPVTGSVKRYRDNYGAMKFSATDTELKFSFISLTGSTIDSKTMRAAAARSPAGTFAAVPISADANVNRQALVDSIAEQPPAII